MPLHDFLCNSCGVSFEAFQPISNLKEVEVCPSCGSGAKKVFTRSLAAVNVFEAQTFEFAEGEVLIESRRQLADECRKRGLVSKYLAEGYGSWK